MPRRWGAAKLFLAIVTAGFLTAGACPSTEQTLLDELKFALDRCNPSDTATLETFCKTAVEKGEALILADPSDENAQILLSSAYFGRSGLDFLELLETFANLIDSDVDDFLEIRNAIASIGVNLGHLESSITTLTTFLAANPAIAATGHEDLFRQLGLMRALDAFIRPVQLAGAQAADVATQLADGSASFSRIQNDFLNADDDLTETEIDDSEILSPIRLNYCLCKRQALTGFNASCLRDLMRCELMDTPAGIENDFDGVGGANAADCLTLVVTDVGTCDDSSTN